MNLSDAITLLSVIVAIIVAVGGIRAFFKSSTGENIIRLQVVEIESLRRTKSDDEKAKVALQEQNNAKDTQIADLRKHNAYLQKLAQGSPQLKKLTTIVENNTSVITNLATIVSDYMGAKK